VSTLETAFWVYGSIWMVSTLVAYGWGVKTGRLRQWEKLTEPTKEADSEDGDEV